MKIIKYSTVLLIVGLGMGTGRNMVKFGYGFNDAFWRVVWAIDEETTWAKDFSEEKFSKVRIGMDIKEVSSLLGEPLHKDSGCDDSCFWIYSWHARGNADFDQRWVVFNNNKKVKEIRKSFFID